MAIDDVVDKFSKNKMNVVREGDASSEEDHFAEEGSHNGSDNGSKKSKKKK